MARRTSTIALMALILWSVTGAAADIIRISYEFSQPLVTEGPRGHQVTIEGFASTSQPGEPMLPVRTARILLPHGQSVKEISVRARDQVVLPGEVAVAHARPVQPIGLAPSSPDRRNERIYSSSTPYPKQRLGRSSEQRQRGHGIVILNLYPVQYTPSKGQLVFAPCLDVVVQTRESPASKKPVRPLRGYVDADNRSALSTYPVEDANAWSSEYLLITSAELLPHFEPLLEWKRLKGIACKTALVEDIAEMAGNDLQERIRNYIRECYQNEGTEYVLLGGDDGIIPARGVYGEVGVYLDTNMPCDLYYAALDGSWDENANGTYGEPDDGPASGEVDLLAEVLVGRAPVDTPEEVRNFVRKTLAYEQGDTPNIPTLVWIGEQLDNITYGSDSKEYVLSLMPEGYSHERLYERTNTFSKQRVLDALNRSPHTVNHLGHSSESFGLGLERSDLQLITNQAPFFVYSQGCYAGAFDETTSGDLDCIGEKLVTMAGGAFSGVFNSRYGWYSPGAPTSGPSHYFDSEFFNTVFVRGRAEPNLAKLGAAHQMAKETLLGRLDEQAMRWCYMNLNLFGDPETTLYNVLSKGTVNLDARVYRSTATPRIVVTDYDMNLDHAAADTLEVRTWSTSESEARSLTLTETGQNSGVFFGQLLLTLDEPLHEQLRVRHGDEITVLYVDADDGSGTEREITAKALIDDVPPVISDLRLTDVRDTSAVVSWSTDEPATSSASCGQASFDVEVRDDALTTSHTLRMSDLLPDSTYKYSVSSTDEAGNTSTTSAADMVFQTKWATRMFFDDIEPGGPSAKGLWHTEVLSGRVGVWTRTLADCHSRRYSWHADDYHSPSAVALDTPPIDLSGVSSPQLVFRQRMLSERNYDGGFVQISADGGLSWHSLAQSKMIRGTPFDRLGTTCPSPGAPAWTGSIPWETVVFDLDDFGNRTIKVRFRMESDSAVDAGDGDGWYIDDVAVTSVHGMIAFDRKAYRPTDLVGITVFDGKANAARGRGRALSIRVSSLAEPGGEFVRPTHSGDRSKGVSAEVRLDCGQPRPDGLVQVHLLDYVTAEYNDGRNTFTESARVDGIPPVIRNVRVLETTADSATIAWETDEPTDACVLYGLPPTADNEIYRPTLDQSHRIRVRGLQKTTAYVFKLICTDLAGNTATDDNNGRLYAMVSGGFELSGSIKEDMTLKAIPGHPWKVIADVRVDPGVALTIEPGAVLKFWHGSRGQNNASLWVYGSVIAIGTAERPIVFTSLKDDSVWGDTNGDGDATQPDWGDWGTVLLGSSPDGVRILEHCVMKYGGWDGNQPCGAVESRDRAAIVRNCRFVQNTFPIAMFLGNQPIAENIEMDGNRFNGIWMRPGSYAGESALDLVGIPYILWSADGRDVTIPRTGDLTVGPGVLVKGGGPTDDTRRASLVVEGRISVFGTAEHPVLFTSLTDDSAIGDTNSDGNDSSPAAGDWGSIVLNGATAQMEHCVVRYAGKDGTERPAIQSTGGSISMRYCEISASVAGLRVGAGSSASISSCTIAANSDYGLLLDALGTGAARNSIFASNGGGGVVQVSRSNLELLYCDSYGNAGGDWIGTNPGEGCFSLDPLFLDASELDFRLADSSPCIDSGCPEETDPDTDSRIDLGAYPWRESP